MKLKELAWVRTFIQVSCYYGWPSSPVSAYVLPWIAGPLKKAMSSHKSDLPKVVRKRKQWDRILPQLLEGRKQNHKTKWNGGPSKIKNRSTIWSSNPTSGHISKRTDSRVLRRYLHTRVHGSTIHNSWEVGTTQTCTDGRVGKQTGVCLQWNIVQPYRNGDSDTCYNMDELWGYYAKSNKPVTSGQI